MAKRSLLTTDFDEIKRRKEEERAEKLRLARERRKKQAERFKAELKKYGKREERQALAALKEFGAMDMPLQVRMGALLRLKEMLGDSKLVEEFARSGEAFFRGDAGAGSGSPAPAGDAGKGDGGAGEAPREAWAA